MSPQESRVHAEVIRHFLHHGHAPDAVTLAEQCSCSPEDILTTFGALEAAHALVLHPDWRKPTIAQANAMFREAGLSDNFWLLEARAGTF